MAGYNPLSYFSFGRKKDTTNAPASGARSEAEGHDVSASRSKGAEPTSSRAVHRAEVEEHEPLLKVTRGNPTEEELAALTAVVVAMQANATREEQNALIGAASRLLNRRQRLGASLRPGPGSWRRARPM